MKPAQKLTIPSDRGERLHYIKRVFSAAKGPDLDFTWAGGRLNALKKLHSIEVSTYARNRNFLNGAVTHLSPYIRHGCLTLHEVFNYVKKQSNPLADRLLMQLAWRDYWRQVWFAEGDAIFSELEPPKAIIHHEPLSEDIIKGKTGLPCMDAFIRDLLTTGYVPVSYTHLDVYKRQGIACPTGIYLALIKL